MAIPVASVMKPNHREEDPGNSCIVCGKAIPERSGTKWVVLADGNATIMTPDEARGKSDAGYYPVGSSCARRVKELKPYLTDGSDNLLPK